MSDLAPVALALPFAASSVAVARHSLQSWLADAGQPVEVIDDSRLVLSELLANAVRHSTPLPDGTVQVSWAQTDDGLDLAVTDGGGDGRPTPVDAAQDATNGRGLRVVEALSSTWWQEDMDPFLTVHAQMRLI